MAHSSEQEVGADAEHAKALKQAATAILQEYTDTLDTTTTWPLELGWLGALVSSNGHSTSGRWGATPAPLLRCKACRRLVIAARAGLHLQLCDPSGRAPGQKQQAQDKPGQAKRQHVPGAPHVKAPHGASKKQSDASGKNSKLTFSGADADVVKPTKLSKTTYPEQQGHRARQTVASPAQVDIFNIPRRRRTHFSRRRRHTVIDVSWLFEELGPMLPPPMFSMPAPRPPEPAGKRLKLSAGGSQPKASKIKMLDGLASTHAFAAPPRPTSTVGRQTAPALASNIPKPPSGAARSSSGHLLRGAALKSHLAKQANAQRAQSGGGDGVVPQPPPAAPRGRNNMDGWVHHTSGAVSHQEQLIQQQQSSRSGSAGRGSAGSGPQATAGQHPAGSPAQGPAAGQQGMRRPALAGVPNPMSGISPLGLPGAGMGLVGGMHPMAQQQQLMAGMMQQHHLLRAAQMQAAVAAQQQQQAAAARGQGAKPAAGGSSMMIPVPGASLTAAAPGMQQYNPMLPHGMNAMMQTQLPMMSAAQMAMMRGMPGMGSAGQDAAGQLPMPAPGMMNPAFPGAYLGMQWPGRQTHDALLGKPAAQPATKQRTVG